MDLTTDIASRAAQPGLIWITGYSASGKTTVGRKVQALLRESGLQVVFLDGDDLRSIFGDHWGYERAQRVDLAKVYFRLCSHLAAQGCTVVISAVAMYDEVTRWVRSNISRPFQVYLNVPEAERRTRDDATKKVYAKAGGFEGLYDEPDAADLVIDNFGSVSPEAAASQIVDQYTRVSLNDRDLGRKQHWMEFYSNAGAPQDASPFAKTVLQKLASNSSIVEIGSGNGRDASYFASNGHRVTAIDLSEAAIERCRKQHEGLGIDFLAGHITDHLDRLGKSGTDVAYSRFVIHAMPLEEELETLQAVATALKPGGLFYLECRSINDPLARKGEVISPTERIHGHYRRFIIADELAARLDDAEFDVLELIESNGLAVFGDDDPVVIRVTARRR